nr:alpha/beta hydrolase [uncultured bacterium]
MTALESRAALEYANWRLLLPLLRRLPAGDGHPVLVLPGFTAADRSTAQLRWLLRDLGYRTYGWRLGANLGPTPNIVQGLDDRVARIRKSNNDAPLTVIGWSLGGIYARVLARANPEHFRQVITLASPFRTRLGDRSAVSALWDSLAPLHDEEFLESLALGKRPPLHIPATSIYTRTDGVVSWKLCLETKSPIAENVEVFGSHSGMGFNTAVAYVIADRLCQTPGDWQRFRSPVLLRGLYPRPKNYRG